MHALMTSLSCCDNCVILFKTVYYIGRKYDYFVVTDGTSKLGPIQQLQLSQIK